MEWLKDKKNLPFVAGGAGLLIVASIVFVLNSMGVFNHSAATPAPLPEPPVAMASRPGPGGASRPPTAPRPALASRRPVLATRPGPGAHAVPPVPGKPSVPGAASPAAALASAGPPLIVNPAAAQDPFDIPILKNGKKVASNPLPTVPVVPLPRPRAVLPATDFYSYSGDNTVSLVAIHNPPTPLGGFPVPGVSSPGNTAMAALPRVAGIIYVGGVNAILEYPNGLGQSQSVKPGDRIDGVGRVTSIDPDGITVRPDTGGSIRIPVSAGTPQMGVDVGAPGAYPGGPGGPPGAYPPGQPNNPYANTN